MPTEEDAYSGKPKKTTYAFYSECRIGDSLIAVLFSKEIPNPDSDASFTVYLGLLSGGGSSWTVAQLKDLTEFVPVQTEFPGNFYMMDGRVNSFHLAAGVTGLHVNLWAVLAGTGSISGASDLIFKASPQKLDALLELKGTSQYSRLGASQSSIMNSTVLAGDVDGDGTAEIVVEKDSIEISQGKRTKHAEKPVLYKMAGGRYEAHGTIEKSEIAARAQALKRLARSSFIRVVTSAEAESETKN